MTKAMKYASFFESINSKTPIDEYKNILDENVKFKDPFHSIQGVEKLFDIFQTMYKNLYEPRFQINEVIENSNIAYINWSFSFKFKENKKEHVFDGVSRVVFNKKNKVIEHIDYWDAAENIYENIPIVSMLIKFIKNRIKG